MIEVGGGITNVGRTAEGFQQRHASYNVGTSGNVSDDSIIQQLQREMFKLREEVDASRRVQTNWDMPNFQGGNDWGGNFGNYGGNLGGVNPNGAGGYGGNFAGKGSSPYGPHDGFFGNSGYPKGKAVLDERFFRRVAKFEGDAQKYRDWKFTVLVRIGQADPELSTHVKRMLLEGGKSGGVLPDTWHPVTVGHLHGDIYDKFGGELYGVLVTLTGGEAKNVLKGIYESDEGGDGFKGMMFLENGLTPRPPLPYCRLI